MEIRRGPLWVDAVEKVGDGTPARNNRIASDDFLNRTCAFATAAMSPSRRPRSHALTDVPGDSAAHHGATVAATARASMKRLIVTRSSAIDRRNASRCQ